MPNGAPRLHWDPMLVALSVYVAVIIGRIHQVIPGLAALKPGLASFAVALFALFVTRSPDQTWQKVDRTWRYVLVGLFVWEVLTIPAGIYPGVSFKLFREAILQSMGLAVIIAIAVRGVDDVRRLIAVFVISVAFYSLSVLRSFGLDLNTRFEGLYSYDTNDFAQVVVCAIPLGISLALQSKRLAVRLFYWLTVGVFLLILIKSGSRGGFLGLVAVGIVALFSWRAVRLRWRLGALTGGVVFLSIFASGMFLSRIASIADANEDYNVTSETGRIQAWKRGMGYMAGRPLLGVGIGAFEVAEGTISALAIQAHQRGGSVKWMAPHNSFVQIGAEAGVPGLVLFTGLCFWLLRHSFRIGRSGATSQLALLGGGVCLSVIGFYVTAFFLSQAYSAILYFLAGIVAGLARFRSSTPI